MKLELKLGDEVEIYEDPMTKQTFEDVATVARIHKVDDEFYDIDAYFGDGEIARRQVYRLPPIVVALLCLCSIAFGGEIQGTIVGGTTLPSSPKPRHAWLTNPAIPQQFDTFSLSWNDDDCYTFDEGFSCSNVSASIGELTSDELTVTVYADVEQGLVVDGPLYDDWGQRPMHLEYRPLDQHVGTFELRPTDRELVAFPDVSQEYGFWHFSLGVEPWPHLWPELVPGDSNNDGRFDSADIVQVFRGGQFETGNVVDWTHGDWNHDGFFDSADLVHAFQAGNYGAASEAVPEPSSALVLLCGIGLLLAIARQA